MSKDKRLGKAVKIFGVMQGDLYLEIFATYVTKGASRAASKTAVC
jgi:hypothetical protein